MAYTPYSLPSAVTVNGTFAFTLYSGIGGMTEPKIQTVIDIGELVEMIDVAPAVSELATFRLKLRDDYSTYTEGFWRKVLKNTTEEPQIKITLTEGVTETYFFYGQVQRSETQMEEHYVDSATPAFFRTFEITLVSLAFKMREVLIANVLSEIVGGAYLVATGLTSIGEPTKICRVLDIFNAFITVAFGQTFAATYAEWVYDGTNEDFTYYNGAAWKSFDDIYIAVYESNGVGGEDLVIYFDPVEASYIPTIYTESADEPKGFEFFVDTLRNFGFAMRHLYGDSDGTIGATPKHRLHLLQRGRTYSGAVTFGSPERLKKSSNRLARDLIGKGVRASTKGIPANFAWRSSLFSSGSFAAPPSNVSFDIEIQALWVVDTADVAASLYDVAGTPLTSIKYYDYFSAVAVEATGKYRHLLALCQYYFMRYLTEKQVYERTYGTLVATSGASTSHRFITPLRRNAIEDGTGTSNYYANKVTKNPKTNTVSVQWIQE